MDTEKLCMLYAYNNTTQYAHCTHNDTYTYLSYNGEMKFKILFNTFGSKLKKSTT